jgi:hypothetical protein
MKYHGKMMIGSNQAGKGDKNRTLRLSKADYKKARKNIDNLYASLAKSAEKEKIQKCHGCKKKKKWKYFLMTDKKYYFCPDCKDSYKRFKNN